MKARTTAICTTMLLLGFSMPAWAVPITFAFSGKITDILDHGSYLDDSVRIGGQVSGWYTFESTATDSNSDPSLGDYYWAPAPFLNMAVGFGSYHLNEMLAGITVDDTAKADAYRVGTGDGGFTFLGRPTSMGITLTDPSALMLTSDRLPLTPPSLGPLPSYFREFTLVARDSVDVYFVVVATLDDLTSIPEPSAVAIWLGLSAGAALLRSKKRNPFIS